MTIRAVLQGSQASSAAASPPALSVTVYRRSIATLYGPGFYGHRTACGVILRRRTIGVANRTLPCGTEVQVYYKGNVMTVPVIDRGPYAHHANWDLTMATGRALGMLGTETVGAASVPTASSTGTGSPAPSAQ
jgi:rare lipoprotein A